MWNSSPIVHSRDACLYQMFEAQVEQTPDAIAVILENKQLTYRQLNQRANQLAHHLRTLGVGTEILVGICMERSLEMVVGLLGILKAGGAYVPLDPEYPLDRLAFILEDTQAPVMLTQEKLVNSLPTHGAQVVCLDSDWEVISQQSQENPLCQTTGNNLVYVIYTSGSTGQPKGVMISHSGICNQLYWRQTAFPLTETDRVLQTISFSFDPSVWQIFWPLSFGAQLILADPGGHKDSAYLVKLIAEQKITVIALVPSMLRVLLEQKDVESCNCLRHVSCGGEPLPVELIDRFFARLNLDGVLHNVYGPTEASIDATFWTCKRGSDRAIAPIGCPITNTQIYILDSNLQVVPVGEPGELHIGGIGLARGYLNRPDLTAEKFIQNPFSREPGARLYKTGDLARYLPDGNIEFLGRIDQQVKIRGFRIELEEIEAALNQHPSTRESVVIAREDVPGDKRLVAYVVANQEPAPTSHQLRSFLKQKVPDYMLPSAFILLDDLPRTPNDKVDRRALPEPDQTRSNSEKSYSQEYLPAQDTLEVQLTKIWEKLLGIQPIGVRDNFFELGGNSLLAVRLLLQIEKIFGKDLPLATLLQAPTVGQLADIFRQEEWSAPWSSLVAIQAGGSKPPLFCIHPVGGGILCYKNLARYLAPDQPLYALQGVDGKQTPLTRIEDMAAQYIKEIQSLQPQGPYFLGGYSFGGLVAFEMAQQLHAQGQKVTLLALLDSYTPKFVENTSVFLYRLYIHGLNISQLGLKEKLIYVAGRIQLAINKAIKKINDRFGKWFGCPSSDRLPEHYKVISDNHKEAFRNYLPNIYPGRVTLFRSMLRDSKYYNDPQLGWGELATAGVEIHEIPGDHETMISEPHVLILAEKLQASLDNNTAQLELSSM
jgi:amino acid adenylation domain-containing protein